MFQCYVCGKKIDKRNIYMIHLKQHESIGQRTIPAYCKQDGCSDLLKILTIKALNRHLRKVHDNELTPNESTFNIFETKE